MSERDALLRGILEQPECDTARLVYADWLDENGQPERAEFIRVQVELARRFPVQFAGPEKGKFETDTQFALRARERVLLRAWHHQWCKAPIVFVPRLSEEPLLPDNARYRRGFVTDIACTAAAFLEHAAAIFAAHPITEVVLSDRGPLRDSGESPRFKGQVSFDWRREDAETNLTDPRIIPAELLDLMAARHPARVARRAGQNRYLESESPADAVAALSRECVAYGRIRAQLTPLPSPQVCVA